MRNEATEDDLEIYLSPMLSGLYPDIAKNLSHTWAESIVSTKFNGLPLTETEDITHWPFKFHMSRHADFGYDGSLGGGNCYSFNSKGDWFQDYVGEYGGLSVELKRPTESCLGTKSCGGYHVMLHAPGTMPTTLETGGKTRSARSRHIFVRRIFALILGYSFKVSLSSANSEQ